MPDLVGRWAQGSAICVHLARFNIGCTNCTVWGSLFVLPAPPSRYPHQALGQALLRGAAPPVQPEASLQAAMAAGAALAAEQQAVLDIRLSREYYKGLQDDIERADERRQRWRQAAAEQDARRRAAAEAAEASRAAAAAAAWEAAAEKRAAAQQEAAASGAAASGAAAAAAAAAEAAVEEHQAQQAQQAAATASGLRGVTPDELAAGLKSRQLVALDVRAAREAEWGRIKGAKQAPYVVASGSSLAPDVRPNPAFPEAARAALGPPEACTATVVLYGPGSTLSSDTSEALVSKEKFVSIAPNGMATVDGQDIVAAAAAALQAAGYPAEQLAELVGGFRAWDLQVRELLGCG